MKKDPPTMNQPARQNSTNFLPPRSVKMSDKEFNTLRQMIYDHAGIEIKEHKRYLLVNRLSKRLRLLGLSDFSSYLAYLEKGQNRSQEFIELIDLVTTNKTDFFREARHFDYLSKTVLPKLMQDHTRNDKTIRIWCAASSSGEEPYTLAIVMAEYLAKHPMWNYQILASDISETILRMATAGIYEQEKVATISQNLLRKYFLKGEKRYKVKPELAQHVTFKKINLKLDFQRTLSNYDIVFCRNVLIYFNRNSQIDITTKCLQVLRPGGYLFLGHSETLHGSSIPHQYVAPSVYQKT